MATICEKNPPNAILHLGDCAADCAALGVYAPLVSLLGNNDYGSMAPPERLLEWEGARILACHGHQYGVKNGLHRLYMAALSKQADAVLFGHTHEPCIRPEGNLLLCNPGSIGFPLYGRKKSYGELFIDNGKVSFYVREMLVDG